VIEHLFAVAWVLGTVSAIFIARWAIGIHLQPKLAHCGHCTGIRGGIEWSLAMFTLDFGNDFCS